MPPSSRAHRRLAHASGCLRSHHTTAVETETELASAARAAAVGALLPSDVSAEIVAELMRPQPVTTHQQSPPQLFQGMVLRECGFQGGPTETERRFLDEIPDDIGLGASPIPLRILTSNGRFIGLCLSHQKQVHLGDFG